MGKTIDTWFGTTIPPSPPPLTDLTLPEPWTKPAQVSATRPLPISEGDERPSVSESLSQLTLGEELGWGGTATVRVGHQRSLGRRVAVKSLHPGYEAARDMLLREARVIGALEHPNIVPIHELAFDAEGEPQMVLKLIEGRTWHEHLGDPDANVDLKELDALEWNIRVIISISQAVSFAHERGVVHRDIKPSNVMIGRFGEVYLVDWGLAASFNDSSVPLPRPRDEADGTMIYMAPEQFEGEGWRVGPWTDVYLMAGSLFHALSGVPPWKKSRGGGRERNQLPESLPQELRWILDKAMASDHAARTQTAATFRQELLGFLRHRGSYALVDRATERVRVFEAARSQGRSDEAERAAAGAALLFRVALDQWADNPAALEGERNLARVRIEDAVARQEPEVARRLLSAMPTPPADLCGLVATAQDHATQEALRIRQMEDDVDVAASGAARSSRLAIGGPLWVSAWVVAALTESATLTLVALIGWLALATLSLLAADRALIGNRQGRTVILNALLTISATAIPVAMTFATDQTLVAQAPVVALVCALGAANGAVAADARAGVYALFWALLIPACWALPSLGLWLVVLGNTVTLGIAGWVNTLNRRRVRVRQSEAPPAVGRPASPARRVQR